MTNEDKQGCGCTISLSMLIWFILWLTVGHTHYMLSDWNPWNISLLVIAALQALGFAL